MTRNSKQLANSEIEYGLRAMIIVHILEDYNLTFSKLFMLDYIITNLNDFLPSHESIHPKTPYRFAKLIVKRNVLKDGIDICLKHGLISITYKTEGVFYKSTYIAEAVIENMSSLYLNKLIGSCELIKNNYALNNDVELELIMKSKIEVHGYSLYGNSMESDE